MEECIYYQNIFTVVAFAGCVFWHQLWHIQVFNICKKKNMRQRLHCISLSKRNLVFADFSQDQVFQPVNTWGCWGGLPLLGFLRWFQIESFHILTKFSYPSKFPYTYKVFISLQSFNILTKFSYPHKVFISFKVFIYLQSFDILTRFSYPDKAFISLFFCVCLMNRS